MAVFSQIMPTEYYDIFASGHNQNRSDNYNQTVTEKVQQHIELDFSGQTWCRFSLSIQAGEKCWCKRRMPSLGRKEQKGPIREKRQERPNQQFSTFLKQGCSDDAQQQLWNSFLGEEKRPHNI